MIWRLYFLLLVVGSVGLALWLPKPAAPTAAVVDAKAVDAAAKWRAPEPRFVAPAAGVPPRPVAIPSELWGQYVAPVATPVVEGPKSWRIVGVAIRPQEPFVLISFDGKDPETRKLGEALPGGSTVASIAQDHICVFIDGDTRKRRKLMLREE